MAVIQIKKMSVHSYHHDNNEYPYVVKGYAANSGSSHHSGDQTEMEMLRSVKHKTTQQLSDQMHCVLNVVNLPSSNGEGKGDSSSRMSSSRSNVSSSVDSARKH